jgi:hypothetical protein
MMVRFPRTKFAQRFFFGLSHCSRGEDEGEGFKQTRFELILTLPLSFEPGEAIRSRCVVQIF